MKTLLLPIISVLLFNYTLCAQSELVSVNNEWTHYTETLKFDEDFNSSSEVEKIQTHLSLVEGILRCKAQTHLTPEQLQNREKALSILNDYWNKGVFPQNTYHTERTPYFIDHLGTHCAVGHLMLMTGHGNIAMQIHNENNYGYVKDLVKTYPEILDWAQEFGFTVQELAWIQPQYAPPITYFCSEECNIQFNCYAQNTEGGTYLDYTYSWSNGETGSTALNLCPGNTYTCTVTDTLGNVVPPALCNISDTNGYLIGTNQITIPLSATQNFQVEVEALASPVAGGIAVIQFPEEIYNTEITWEWNGVFKDSNNLPAGWNTYSFQSGPNPDFFWCTVTDSVFISTNYSLCPGDLNLDGVSNSQDVTKMLLDYGCHNYCESDLNYDGIVGSSDLTLLLAAFGKPCNY